jgi:hypothetical protein
VGKWVNVSKGFAAWAVSVPHIMWVNFYLVPGRIVPFRIPCQGCMQTVRHFRVIESQFETTSGKISHIEIEYTFDVGERLVE